ncbi:MAG: TetR/AcrR family transcriptional regulator [Bacteroides sp.]|nr:TetR/AcrR family transcriptional regulator [Prevotella sp.]MCM1407754.1 TetR/AcrR family transcriptional regulator [Treponema brennaborense]MCM1469096.1 TetR/AcrR family transcriptional regulator [Bacteroides sp.]
MTGQTKYSSGKNTKELILQAAFESMTNPSFKEVSLSDIACHVGITKPAIFRHYKNKKALFSAMQERFFDDAAACLCEIASGGQVFQKYVSGITVFFAEHHEYLCFFIYSFVKDKNFEQFMMAALEKRGVPFIMNIYRRDPRRNNRFYFLSPKGHFQMEYVLTSIFFFIATQGEKKIRIPAQQFAERLSSLLFDGWHELPDISEKRLAELDEICRISKEQISQGNRFASALSGVIGKWGFPGITMERMAAELGMTKSSLYSHFKNRDAMLQELIGREFSCLSEFLKKHYEFAQSMSEAVYIHFITEMHYLLCSQLLLPVLNWLRIGNISLHRNSWDSGVRSLFAPPPYDFLCAQLEHPAFGIDSSTISLWISSLPIFLLCGDVNENETISAESGNKKIKALFKCVCKGIENAGVYAGENKK